MVSEFLIFLITKMQKWTYYLLQYLIIGRLYESYVIKMIAFICRVKGSH